MSLKKVPVLKVIAIIWIVFASLYVVYGEYQRVQVMVAQRAYNSGLRDAAVQLIQQSQTCKAVPITVDGQTAQLINLECLNAAEEEAEE